MQTTREISTINNCMMNLRDMGSITQEDLKEVMGKLYNAVKATCKKDPHGKAKQMPFYHGAKNEQEIKNSFSGVKINDNKNN